MNEETGACGNSGVVCSLFTRAAKKEEQVTGIFVQHVQLLSSRNRNEEREKERERGKYIEIETSGMLIKN